MAYIYLVLSVFLNASASVLGKLFNRQCEGQKKTSTFYNFFLLISVFAGWSILYIFDLSFNAQVILYSVLFALFYTSCNIGIINALKYGPMMLTSLFLGLSLILTALWGFIFWDSPINLCVITGLMLICIAVYLCLYSGKKDEKGFSWKWLGYTLLAVISNAGCSIVQRSQQVKFDGKYGNMLMFFATLFSVVVYLAFYLKSRDSHIIKELKTIWWIPILAGVCNVILNLLVMMMAMTDLSPSLIYPVIGVGGLGVVTIVSLFVFKEKMRWWQWIGIGVGAVAIALLSM